MKGLTRLASQLFNAPLFLELSKAEILAGVYEAKLRGEPMMRLDDDGGGEDDVSGDGAVAIISIHGTLLHRTSGLQSQSGFTSYKTIGAQLKAAVADASVAGIMLNIDSNGGQVAGCPDLASAIFKARETKPVYAFVDERAFSAAYMLASAAHRIYIPRTGGVGSVGTLLMLRDQSVADEMAGLKYTAIFAGKQKLDGNPHEPLPDDVRARFQVQVDQANDLLIETVARHRPRQTTAEKVRALQAGVFYGQDGIAAGLADELATYDEAMAALGAAAAAHPARNPTLRSRLYAVGAVPALLAAKDAGDDEIEPILAAVERGEAELQPPGPAGSHNANAEGDSMSDGKKTEVPATPAPAAAPAQPAATVQPVMPAADAATIERARAEGEAQAASYAREIDDLCALAGCPEKAAGFRSKKVAIADVRSSLLAAKASKTDADTVVAHQPASGAQAGDHGWSKIVAKQASTGGFSPAGRVATR